MSWSGAQLIEIHHTIHSGKQVFVVEIYTCDIVYVFRPIYNIVTEKSTQRRTTRHLIETASNRIEIYTEIKTRITSKMFR